MSSRLLPRLIIQASSLPFSSALLPCAHGLRVAIQTAPHHRLGLLHPPAGPGTRRRLHQSLPTRTGDGKGTIDSSDEPKSIVSETLRAFNSPKGGLNGLEPDPPPAKPTILQRVKGGLLHYWHGSKLLVYEIRVSSKLLFKLLRGHKLVRREHKQLLRTTSDLFRLVPFAVIVIVPFLEFALPVLLRLFPNMLPSTFEDKLAAEEKLKKQVKIKLEMAKFLQQNIETMAADGAVPNAAAAKKFGELFRKARITGEPLTIAEIVAVCQQLGDSLTLDNLTRPQLVSICRYMGINAFGTDNFLRFQIRNSMRTLKKDDLMIASEGVSFLTLAELQQACQVRGIRTIGRVDRTRLEHDLQQWLDLHLQAEISPVLLILSRAFSLLQDEATPEKALQATIMSLPDHVVDEAELHATKVADNRAVSPRQKLQVLQHQEALIADELEQEREEQQIRAPGPKAPADLSKAELENLREALSVLAAETPTVEERQGLRELREERAGFQKDIRELEQVSANKMKESRAATMLGLQVEKLIGQIDSEVKQAEAQIGSRLNLIQPGKEGQLTVGQLELLFRMIRRKPGGAERISAIIGKFDLDGDGKVFISDIMKMAREAEECEGQGVLKPSSSNPAVGDHHQSPPPSPPPSQPK